MNPLVLPIVVFLILVIIRTTAIKLFGFKQGFFYFMVMILVFLLFGEANFADPDVYRYYVSFALVVIACNNPAFSILEMGRKSLNIGELKLKGVTLTAFYILMGLGLTYGMFVTSSRDNSYMIGVPKMSVSSAKSIAATTFGTIGFIENAFFFTIGEIISALLYGFTYVPVLNMFFSIDILRRLFGFGIVSFIFGFFHWAVFGMAFSAILWAASVFFVWSLLSRYCQVT